MARYKLDQWMSFIAEWQKSGKTREELFSASEASFSSWHIFINLLGTAFARIGIALLYLPWQGLLTLFAGLLLMDFPKRREIILSRLIKTNVKRTDNKLRARKGQPPILYETISS